MSELELLKNQVNDLAIQVKNQNMVIEQILKLIDTENSLLQYLPPPKVDGKVVEVFGPRLKSHKPKS